MKYKCYEVPPADFKATVEVTGCYCTFEDKFLFLKRQKGKSQEGKWGIPAGKLEKDEDPKKAVIREVFEEVGIVIKPEELELIGERYMRLPHVDYIWHSFHAHFTILPVVNLELKEHEEARWLTPNEAFDYPVIAGGHEALNQFLNHVCLLKSKRH